MKRDDILKLEAKTLKAKNRLREAGTQLWRVLEVAKFQGVPSVLVEPINETKRGQRSRWIAENNDLNFTLTSEDR